MIARFFVKTPTDLLYPTHRQRRLPESVFRRPSAEYRGTPFWAWNGELKTARLRRQIGQFAQMGYGGFHLHARTGLSTPYLGDAFMARVRECTDEAKRRKMLAWLYDEDRWPSGFAGGLVTVDPAHRGKYFLFTRTAYNGTVRPPLNWSHAHSARLETGTRLARYAVELREGCLHRYRRLAEGTVCPATAEEWFLYLETSDGVDWFNHQGYVDTLSPAAIARFIEVTHERYRTVVGKEFGRTIPAIFTDEPQHIFREFFDHATQGTDLTMPATNDFIATYREAYGANLLDTLPEVFWELPGGVASITRYRYHDHVTARFADAFAAQLGRWCGRHGLLLTGHMMEEPTLFSQTRATGEAMRSLAYFQLPGIDMLCDQMEFTTAKQAQSVAHQEGRPGVMSELYGVTGWSYDFVGHKAQGDWQAALGVTVRVPHLAWMSMAGEAKRDYPASIHYQSPWWREYSLVEDHFARVNVVLSRGTPCVRIGVLHPIESYWLSYGPLAQTKIERERQERLFAELPRWLLGALMDFDYISESLLGRPSAGSIEGRSLRIGRMCYDVVVVPLMRTMRRSTLKLLEDLVAAGGTVVWAGEVPSLVDVAPSPRPARVAARAVTCAWESHALLAALAGWREVDCVDAAGIRNNNLLYQLRDDGSERHLFLCHLDRKNAARGLTVRVRGTWRVFGRDTLTGGVSELPAVTVGRETHFPTDLEAHGHLLVTLRPGRSRVAPRPRAAWKQVGELADPVRVTLSEPNVLLLNQAEWRWNGGAWQGREETLRLHNLVRRLCGLPDREGHVPQPWTDHEPAEELGRVELRFKFTSDRAVRGAELAIEEAVEWNISLDGRPVAAKVAGWWVDEDIHRVRLPAMAAGGHVLTLGRAFSRKTELEWCYLLGDFGVELAGRHARLTAPVRQLAFGDWTRQGLPFYAGNVTYHCVVAADGAQPLAVRFPLFRAPLLTVAANGGKPQPVGFAPFRATLGRLRGGQVNLDVTAFGNRDNVFGPVHNINPNLIWIGPDAWRTEGDHWSYQYQLKPMGLLVAPRVEHAQRVSAGSSESAVILMGESAWSPRRQPKAKLKT